MRISDWSSDVCSSDLLLRQVADEIGVGLEMLDGATERRLASDLTEVIADPLFDRMRPEPQAIDGLVGRYPALARAVVTLHRAFLDRSQAMHTLADRLNQIASASGRERVCQYV